MEIAVGRHSDGMARLTLVKNRRSDHDCPDTEHIHENIEGELVLWVGQWGEVVFKSIESGEKETRHLEKSRVQILVRLERKKVYMLETEEPVMMDNTYLVNRHQGVHDQMRCRPRTLVRETFACLIAVARGHKKLAVRARCAMEGIPNGGGERRRALFVPVVLSPDI